MKIYTKKGDEGNTSLLGGERVSKSHIRIDAYGHVDELNACLGFIGSAFPKKSIQGDIVRIQTILFTLGSHLAANKLSASKYLPKISNEDVRFLELQIDKMDQKLNPLKNFILPSGSLSISYCHIARCICRRTERSVVLLHTKSKVNPIILTYLNRLSDYLFVLARYSAQLEGIKEVVWKPHKVSKK